MSEAKARCTTRRPRVDGSGLHRIKLSRRAPYQLLCSHEWQLGIRDRLLSHVCSQLGSFHYLNKSNWRERGTENEKRRLSPFDGDIYTAVFVV